MRTPSILIISVLLWMSLSLVGVPVVQAQGCSGAPAIRLQRGEQAEVIVANGSNLRRRPSSGERLLNIIPPGTIIPVMDGPFCAEGYTWWQVQYDNDRGWVAEGTNDNYWLAPYVPLQAQIDTVRVTVPPELAESIQTRYDAGRVVLSLESYPVSHPVYTPEIRVFDALPGYDEVPAVRAVLFEGDRSALDETALTPLTYINFADGTGVRYVSVFVSRTESIPPTLLYSFRGISRDNHYVSFNFPIEAPDLPLPYEPDSDTIDSDNDTTPAAVTDYVDATRAALQQIPPRAYTPMLDRLDEMAQSLTTSATPLPLTDQLQTASVTMDENNITIRIDYLPAIISDIGLDTVRAQNDQPRHWRLRLDDYAPARSTDDRPAYIRLYESDALDGDWLVGLQLLLSQKPLQPNRIPILSRLDATPQQVAQVGYFPFASGEGMRALLTYDGETWWYSYQALTEDNNFYVSVLLPITLVDAAADPASAPPDAFYPWLNVIDTIIKSISIEP